jgi:hypothetical protein
MRNKASKAYLRYCHSIFPEGLKKTITFRIVIFQIDNRIRDLLVMKWGNYSISMFDYTNETMSTAPDSLRNNGVGS